MVNERGLAKELLHKRRQAEEQQERARRHGTTPASVGDPMTSGHLSLVGIGISADDLAARYNAVASDGKKAVSEREASVLYSVAETHVDEEQADEALKASKEALAAFKGLKDATGIADSLRLVISAHRLKDESAEALKLAQDSLADFENSGNKRGQACMLMSLAEMASEKPSTKAKQESVEQGVKAVDLFREISDAKMEAAACLALSNAHLVVGTATGKKEAFTEAKECADTAFSKFSALGDKTSQGKATHSLALCAILQDDFDTGLMVADNALNIFAEAGPKKMEAFEQHCIAMWNLAARNPDAALKAADAAYAAFDTLKYGKGYAIAALSHKVQAYLDQESGRTALKTATDALEKAKAAGDTAGEVTAQQALFASHCAMSDKEEALSAAKAALALVDGMEKKSDKTLMWQAEFLRKIAKLHADEGEAEEAHEFARKAVKICRKLDDKTQEAVAMCSLSEVCIEGKLYSDALYWANQAREIFQAEGNARGEGFAYLTITNGQAAKGDYRRAAMSAKAALELFEGCKCQQGEADALFLLTQLQCASGDFQAAIDSGKKGQEMRESLKETEVEFQQMLLIAQASLCSVAQEASGKPSQFEVDSPEWKEAQDLAEECVSKAKGMKIDLRIVEAIYLLAQVHLAKGESDEASDLIDEAMELVEKNGFQRLEAQLGMLTSALLYDDGKKAEAKDSLEEALSIFESLNDEEGTMLAQAAIERCEPKVSAELLKMMASAGAGMGQAAAAAPTAAAATDDAGEGAPAAASAAESAVAMYKGPTLDEVMGVATGAALDLIGIEELSPDTPLMDAGLDSLAAVEYGSILAKEFKGVQLPSTLMFDFPSTKQISDFVYQELRAAEGFE
mmetsp:Transcript_138255/g.251731  ORF Transcript_138255/g.251731 Transcript_138255/m.251731 type:complete len:858 (+) Transcript_138255:70-2643(+)